MHDREAILSAIRRMAVSLDGRAPGKVAFMRATGIPESSWSGRYWSKWGDAIKEAGLTPNVFNRKTKSDSELADAVGDLALRLGSFPTHAEMRLEKRSNADFPSADSLQGRLGSRAEMIEAVLQRSIDTDQKELKELLKPLVQDTAASAAAASLPASSVPGRVYILQSGNHFKIGKTDNLDQRIRQIQLSVPGRLTEVHVLETDDPSGIELYWHRRFASKRVEGEWFLLDQYDVAAFKRRGSYM